MTINKAFSSSIHNDVVLIILHQMTGETFNLTCDGDQSLQSMVSYGDIYLWAAIISTDIEKSWLFSHNEG